MGSPDQNFNRAAFSERLRASLSKLGVPVHSPAKVAKAFNEQSSLAPVTPQAVRKWLVGDAIPSQGKLLALAKWLGVSAEWLSFGTGEVFESSSGGPELAGSKNRFILIAPEHMQIVPLLNKLARLNTRDYAIIENAVEFMLNSGE